MAQSSQNIDEVVEKIIGYAERIDTPFGEMCTLSCDLSSNGRLYQPIEDSVGKLRSHLMQRYQMQTFDGNFTHNMYSYSVNTILEFFGLNSKQYQIEECGSHEISPYTYLGKILQINYPSRKFKQDEQVNDENKRMPQVYVSTSESYYNILPWSFYGCNLHSIDVNKQSEINVKQLIDKLSKSSENDLHIVSLSAVSNITGQKIPNLDSIIQGILGLRAEMEQRNKNIKIYLCLDITQIAQREKINAKEGVYKDVDFFIVQGTKLLGGGFDCTNILISRKESATNILQPQKPLQDTNNNILDSLTENNDATKLYRIALALQLLENITFEKIREIEKKNLDLFLKEIAGANKDLKKISVLRNINVWGFIQDKTESFSYGNLHVNVYLPGSEVFDSDNKSYLHPDLVCQLLHDLFGIQATMKRNVNLNEKIVMLNIPKNISTQLESIGSTESMLGCFALDISFLHKEEEIKYIAQALKLICEKGDEFIRYYDKNTFLMNKFAFESYDLHLNQMLKVNDTREQIVKKRIQKYDSQMQVAKTVFKNYTRYFSLHDGYTKEKTLQIQKKEAPFCMPPPLAQKSIAKLPDDISDESVLSLQKVAIEKAQAFVRAEIARLEQERLKNQKLVSQGTIIVNRPPSPEKVEAKPQEPTVSKDEIERSLQEMIEKKLYEKSQKEKQDMEKMLEQMKREMQDKIDQSSGYKEQFVFEDLQPSVMFKNVLDHREKRYRNIRQIFNNYAKLNLEQQEQEPKGKKSRFDIVNSSSLKNDKQNVAYTINIQQYIMFCNQFNLLNDQLDVNVVTQIYAKSLGKSSSSREMHFTEFVSSLERIALVLYYNHELLITSFDKTEALYQYLQIDDIHQLKKKMSLPLTRENFAVNKSQYFNSTPSNRTEVQSSHKNNIKTTSPGTQTLHQLDYDSINTPQQRKYIPTNSSNQYSVNQKASQFSNHNNNNNLNWSEINSVMVNPQSLFKNESNFLYHEYGNASNGNSTINNNGNSIKNLSSYSKVNSSQLTRNPESSQSAAYLHPSNNKNINYQYKYSSQSPLKSTSDKQNSSQSQSLQQIYGYNPSPDNRKNNLMNRIKEIEDSEIKKQKDLLHFLQSNMSNNRYKSNKKKI